MSRRRSLIINKTKGIPVLYQAAVFITSDSFVQFYRKLKDFVLFRRLALLYYYPKYKRQIARKTPIFIYQMGKVASTSIELSLKKVYPGLVIHSHSFRADYPNNDVRALYRLYQKEKFPIKIITLIRDPISRNLSAFFEDFAQQVGVHSEKSTHSPEEIQQIFLDKFNHDIILNWFDTHISDFGIDVYDHTLTDNSHLKVKKENVELLLMKHNLDDSKKEQLVKEFVGVPELHLKNENMGDKKHYSKLYNSIRNLPMPDWYVSQMLDSKYVNHFYTLEKEHIRKKWA